jgi:tetratricopeptide (TPR) repeat protein
MAIKKFRPALDDCQQAAILQSASPSPKTLIRLARCQLAVDSPMSALSTLSSALSIEPSNEAALQLKKEALELDAHLRAETIKEEGNIAFKAKNFDDAIELYTKAIGRCHHAQVSQHRH